MDLLRFSTAGSVDDGKSTLIGRLLYDAKGVFEDQLEAAGRATRNPQAGAIDLSLLTDGLRAEREQGITIDVAYRYFATPRRKFIIADTPGHEQYTRNMATGASTADLAIVLVDARKGLTTQSRRHATIARLLGIRHLVLAVNKMDLVGFDALPFERIRREFLAFAGHAPQDLAAIPVSALAGDNIVARSARMPWYRGPSLLEHLESVESPGLREDAPLRFPVQLVSRPDADFRGYAGQVASGSVRAGDAVRVLPSGRTTRIARIHTADGDLDAAHAPQSVTLVLEDELDVSRGDLIVHAGAEAEVAREFEADLVWMDDRPLEPGRPYLIKHTTHTVRARIAQVQHRLDVTGGEPVPADTLALNEIGRVSVVAARPLALDRYEQVRATGSFIVIDPESHHTVAAGMVAAVRPGPAPWSHGEGPIRLDRAARETHQGHRGGVFLVEPSVPESELYALEAGLWQRGLRVYRLPGEPQAGAPSGRAAAVATLLDAGFVVLVPVSGGAAARRAWRRWIGPDDLHTVGRAARGTPTRALVDRVAQQVGAG